ncbi:MAG: response regulator, partial [Acidimicrobiia bacterium]
AESARDAVLAFSTGRFDVLVVDYAMPRSNGVDLVRALRAGNVKIPIVMVSGVANSEEQAAAWEAGVNAYLDKNDLRMGALVSTLRGLLDGPAA